MASFQRMILPFVLWVLLFVVIFAEVENGGSSDDPQVFIKEDSSYGEKPIMSQLKEILHELKSTIDDDQHTVDKIITTSPILQKSDMTLDDLLKESESVKIRPQNTLAKLEVSTFEESKPFEVDSTEKPNIQSQIEAPIEKTPELPMFREPIEVKISDSKSSDDAMVDVKVDLNQSIPTEVEENVKVPSKDLEHFSDLTKPENGLDTEGTDTKPDKIKDSKQEKTEDDVLETYSQFAQRLSAQKKSGETANQNSGNLSKGSAKVKGKNYASQECGSKIISSNPQSKYADRIIDPDKDAYLLNECSHVTWVIIELCDAIRPQKFSVANFELFSNQPKEINVHGSYRFPTREWHHLGTYEGEERNRDIQSFHIHTNEFVKYIKVEITSHYGSEFFCPLSLVQVHGISEYEAIDHFDDDADDVIEDQPAQETPDENVPWQLSTLLRSVLGLIRRGSVPENTTTEIEEQSVFISSCSSLSSTFAVQSSECAIYESLNYIISCYNAEYETLLTKSYIKPTVEMCESLAQSLCAGHLSYETMCNQNYPCVMLTPKHMLALCHIMKPSIIREMTCNSTVSVSMDTDNTTIDTGVIPVETIKPDAVVTNMTEEIVNKTVPVEKVKTQVNNSNGVNDTEKAYLESKVSPPNKETVIVRLNNKIKMLDHNMSISNQYLEELSRRYKQQMEDMQRQINETNASIATTHQLVLALYNKSRNRLDVIDQRIEQLLLITDGLVRERDYILNGTFAYHMIFICVQLVFVCVHVCCCSRRDRQAVPRRQSFGSSVIQHRRRRPSDCSLRLSGNYTSLLRKNVTPKVSNGSPRQLSDRRNQIKTLENRSPISVVDLPQTGNDESLSVGQPCENNIFQYIDDDKVPYYGTILDGKFYEFVSANGNLESNVNVERLTSDYKADFNAPVISDYYERPTQEDDSKWLPEDPIEIPPTPVPIASLGTTNHLSTENWEWYARQSPTMPNVNTMTPEVSQKNVTQDENKEENPKKKRRRKNKPKLP